MAELRDAGILMRLMNKAMINMGVDVATIYQRCGIQPELLQEQDLRTPHQANLIFWNVAESVTQDPNVGLHFGEHMPVFRGQVLEYLFLSSPTFGEGLKRSLSYQRLLTDAAQATLELSDDLACLVTDTQLAETRQLRHFNDCSAVGLIKFFRYVTEDAFRPSKLSFSFEAPEDLTEYQRIFECPVDFSQPSNRIYFKKELLDLPSFHAESELLQLHEQLADQHVAKLEQQDVVHEVRKIIGESLETSQVTLESVAERMSLSARQLRSALSHADTSFNQLLADYRCRFAKRLLVCTDESIDEIVYLTGFSEPSTFYRAFKRWTGLTPVEYRKQKTGVRA
ncbi:AraC family transcriptional regulator [Litoribrevibacter euphylliae]|uniref:AraC family transcriptional regulator n=1 Tax=Litoribrevibacter euphylliae TaxID=1834034 RepID=A0ABV7HIB6_9GAMM